MRLTRLSPKTILVRLSHHHHHRRPFSLLVAHFSSFSSPNIQHSFSRRQQQGEESRNVRVSVWWDFENCNLPAGVNVFRVAHAITAAVRGSGIKGPVTITAFGDVLQLSRTNQEALSATGVNLAHVPNGGKNSADRSLLVDLMYWVSQNPPPAHLFLISSDRDFASILHRLRMNNYNILLASRESAPGVLCSAASIMWDWYALVRGENIAGRYFNQPPDGPFGSCYGHYKGPLEDPFADAEQLASVKTEELPESNSSSPFKPHPIPRQVVRQLSHILSTYPKGISIVDLRAELIKRNITIDKDYYGYKKFSRFLLSMPDILTLQLGSEGHFLVLGVSRARVPFDSGPIKSTGSDVKNMEVETPMPLKSESNVKSTNRAIEARTEEPPRKPLQNIPSNYSEAVKSEMKMPEKIEQEPVLVGQHDVQVTNEQESKDQPASIVENDAAERDGFLRKLKRLWFGSDPISSETKAECPPDNGSSASGDNSKSKSVTNKSAGPDANAASSLPYFSTSIEPAEKVKISDEGGDHKSESPGLFNRILKWFKFKRNDTMTTNLSDRSSGTQGLVDGSSQKKHDIFAEDSFWNDMESFVNSTRGSAVISQSRTREEMAQNLQKGGPLCLKSLSEADLLHLVALLISEKKWIEKCPSQETPFRIKVSGMDQSRVANGLRTIFLGSKSQSTGQISEKKSQNVAHTGVSLPSIGKKPSNRSRDEVLVDCQNLVKQILKEHPEGYNIGCFRKDFLERYGYHLSVHKLGYQKLQSLLQIMPGARIESGYVVPSSMVPDAELSGKSRKEDDSDSTFEELGPVSKTTEEMQTKKLPEYEPSLSGDETSDSEGENSVNQSERGMKREIKTEDSSLLQILDSWYSSKEVEDRKEKTNEEDSSIDISKPSSSSGAVDKTEISSGSYRRCKQKPTKTYSFVSDSVDDNQEQLIDGILGSLKKSRESRMQE